MSLVSASRDRFRRLEPLSSPPADVWAVEDHLRPGFPLVLREIDGAAAGRLARLAAAPVPGMALAFEPEPLDGGESFDALLERVKAEPLAAAVAREGTTAWAELGADLLRALGHLHAAGSVHGRIDRTSARVRLAPRAGTRAAILWWGLDARHGIDPATVAWTAPECFEGSDPATAQADLYALGVVLYEGLWGRLPLEWSGDAKRFAEASRAGRRKRPVPPAGVPEPVATWLGALLDPDPARRPADADAALAGLEAAWGAPLRASTLADRAARVARGAPAGHEALAERLAAELERADGPCIVWLRGPAGSGKARLCAWLAAGAAGRGWRVRSGIEAIANPLSEGGPCLVVLENPDAGAEPLLAETLEADARLRVLVSAEATAELPPALTRFLEPPRRAAAVATYDLAAVDGASLAAILGRAEGALPRPGVVRRLAEASGGLAGVAEELATAGEPFAGDTARRVGELGPGTRCWLEALAASGANAPGARIARVAGLTAEAAAESACAAAAAGIARERRGRWSFASTRLGDSCLHALEPARRGRLQARAAVAARGTPAEAAPLWAALGRGERAAAASAAAASEARRSGRTAEAVAHVVRAQAWLERDDAGRVEIDSGLAEVRSCREEDGRAALERARQALDATRLAESIDAASIASARGREIGDPCLFAEAVALEAEALGEAGRSEEAAGIVLRARRLAGSDAGATLWLDLAHARRGSASADDLPDRLVERALALDQARSLAAAEVVAIERRAASGEDIARLLEALSRSDARPAERARALIARAGAEFVAGRPDEADTAAREAGAIAEGAGLPLVAARAAAIARQALEALDRPAEAGAERRRAREMLERAASAIGDPELERSFRASPLFQEIARGSSPLGGGADRRLTALYEMIRALNRESDPEVLLASILDMAIETVGAERGMVLLGERDDGALSLRLARNMDREAAQDVEALSRGVVAEAAAGRSVLSMDAREDPRFRGLASVSAHRLRSLMCVPLRCRGTVRGAVYLDARSSARAFSAGDLRFLEAFADHAALALDNARAETRLALENRRLQAEAERRARFAEIVGSSLPMRRVFELVDKLAPTEFPVLITGESGTGKELVAKAIHYNGPRRRAAFVSENCAALPPTLLQSELFGHVRGAFTGAERDRGGLFEQADGGTLFLDEIGEMPQAMQVQLLRAVQEGEIRRVGDERPRRVDVRLVGATHRNLEREVASGRFREDLYYRLKVLSIALPALRERAGDVSLLIDHFLDRIARERGRDRTPIDRAARDRLERHDWPGNVRQLENTLRRLAVLAGDAPIDLTLVDEDPSLGSLGDETPAPASSLTLRGGEREQIAHALAASGGNRAAAARVLGISRATIFRKIKDYGL